MALRILRSSNLRISLPSVSTRVLRPFTTGPTLTTPQVTPNTGTARPGTQPETGRMGSGKESQARHEALKRKPEQWEGVEESMDTPDWVKGDFGRAGAGAETQASPGAAKKRERVPSEGDGSKLEAADWMGEDFGRAESEKKET